MRLSEAGCSMQIQIIALREADYTDKSRKWNTKWHKHSFYEVHAPREGGCLYQFEGEDAFRLGPGSVLLIRPEVLHQVTRRSEDYVKDTLAFQLPPQQSAGETEYLTGLLGERPYRVFERSALFSDLFDRILEEAMNQRIGYHLSIYALIKQLIVEVARSLPAQAVVIETDREESLQDWRIVMVKRFIDDNIAQRVSNADLAAHLHVSTKQLNRIVNRECGLTPQRLISKMKCVRAKEMMTENALPLKVLAEELGFSSEYSFIRCFKREEGMTPGMFRRDFK